MGRYVNGTKFFDYKFAFAEQSSSFGEVLEDIVNEANNEHESGIAEVTRFISEAGEIVRLDIENKEELEKVIINYVGDFQEMTQEERQEWSRLKLKKDQYYWDKFMMREFANELKEYNPKEGETLEFDVEY
jgi:hypothetical protein